ncbi:MAG: hypothetical protein K8E66_13185 [Phycisphaerales bacterium]|nr:hypothetical protein [Phycisphaerales bacterium]
MNRTQSTAFLSLLTLLLRVPLAGTARGADSFLESDDFEEGESIVGVFLVEDDYRIMVEDIERNDTSFDWGWVLTPGFQDSGAPPPDTRHKALRWIPRKSAQKLVQQPRQLGFDLRDYRTIYIPPVENFAGIMKEELLVSVRDSFIEGAKMFDLEVVTTRPSSGLELRLATLDQMRDVANVPVYGIRVQPFLLLELQLIDLETNQKLVLLRNRKHGNSVAEAALNFADDFVKFLR